MRSSSHRSISIAAGVFAVINLFAAAVASTMILFVTTALLGVLASLVALWAWQADQADAATLLGNRWHFVVGGLIALGIAIAVALVDGGDLSARTRWWTWALSTLGGIMLVVGGVVTGLVDTVHREDALPVSSSDGAH